MAISKAEFMAMTPQPYSQVREQLMTGDILLFSSVGGFSSVIEEATDSLWSHAGLVWRVGEPGLDRVLILESIENIGIRAVAASSRFNGTPAAPRPYAGHLLVARHRRLPQPAPAATVVAMTRFGIDHLGYPYNAAELVRIASRITLGLLGISLGGEVKPTTAYICSEFVARCFDAIDIDLTPDREGFMAPADIAADADVFAVLALCPDPARDDQEAPPAPVPAS
jgi:hypothetical protein